MLAKMVNPSALAAKPAAPRSTKTTFLYRSRRQFAFVFQGAKPLSPALSEENKLSQKPSTTSLTR